MQFNGLKANGRNLARGCAVLMIAGAAAGCSSQAMRFNGVDDVFTSSTNNQRAIINKQGADQPYPGDTVAPAPVDGTHTQSVSRSSLEPVTSQQLPPPSAPAAAPAKPMRTASAPALAPAPAAPHLDKTATGTVEPAAKPFKTAEPDAVRNASAAPHATEIVVREGETISGLARQYHVPADAIIKVNGLDASKGVRTGQKIVIPAYAYSSKGEPKAADAGKPANTPKQPAGAPEKVAVLPQQPKLKDGKSAAQVDASAAASGSKNAKPAQMADAKPAGAGGTYTVQQGDSLSSIARKTGVGVTALKQANGMKDGLLKIGQTLKVPAGGTVAAAAKPAATKSAVDPVTTATTQPPAKTTPSETLASYTPPKKDAKVIQQAEDDDAVAPDATGIGKMRWPVRGRVISGFGSGKDGVDIAVPEGTPIKAAENGVVIYAGDGLKEFGNTVLVRHENGLVTVYGHASSIEVQRGQKVKRGQEIALSGMSGTTDSPKLHFEVRKNSAPVDPSGYLE
ncbi:MULTISPECIES: LysM peptidoglycan-binding domain-containing M23 family metallopeptidase [unclassified Mesorhizobium]|uniref:LysM peptidoglycan-binding domain-containing M23 family metallopeptidase n=1 Tax=unclassified Mesorhizobium TaxID=325217 RepID=UPI000FCACE3E|nr:MULTISPECIES: LysM peptidoglycan-binding domain-containing M23 family metallopeptidase [unclassified Mesorhizobium]TGP26276.1 LysM peptidoglycan-binding domain-containing protein [Mesorhizobium sp. M1D.F.Ca.ET.231.01.1.1]TGP38234.1 LysM peptidoglycan-binding domain-containing protein [Mesorhizobium sp. M1D.F.Ca.ET.234.01.1.1]TGS50445.1 LysM peptidoglycan-binding domain-containing protein [Mesorhizobium sp. M1D.F.Ca.ET.184.01.1.1]TGS66331.1 LysM peptidoglycan-binding domain-containing protein